MNPHVLQGIVAFIIWSIFSTWYYVTQIKEWSEPTAIIENPIPEPKIEKVDTLMQSEPINEVMDVDFSEVLFFDLNQTVPKSESKLSAIIDSIANLQKDVSYLLKITGHTCDLGSKPYNDSLAWVRARSISVLLQPSISKNIHLEVFSKGETEPSVANSTEKNRAKNRRVEIQITN
jgi:outer membrane protein OmpA-like peptidoglycan-associated protein